MSTFGRQALWYFLVVGRFRRRLELLTVEPWGTHLLFVDVELVLVGIYVPASLKTRMIGIDGHSRMLAHQVCQNVHFPV